MEKKILVVDDEPDFVKLIQLRLEDSGYSVVTASDGKEGLDKISKNKFDAVFLDILMPKLNGLQALKKIRKHDKHVPIFIITANADQKRFLEAKKQGASGFIIKTGDLKKEIKNITSMLEISGQYNG